jgi:hypothetical protein
MIHASRMATGSAAAALVVGLAVTFTLPRTATEPAEPAAEPVGG